MNLRKLIVIGSASLAGLAMLIFVILRLLTSTITISTEANAQIFARQNGSEQKQIGTGQATFKTRSSAPVIIEVRSDDKVTQKAVRPRRLHTTAVSLELKPLAKTSFFAQGPFTYPLVSGRFIYGINPHTNSLTAKPLGKSTAAPPQVPLLPALKQIVWFKRDHFIYITRGQGGGEIGGIADLHPSAHFISAVEFPNRKGLALLASDGVYLTPSYDIEHPSKFAELKANSTPAIFTADSDIWLTSLLYKPAKTETTTPEGDKTIVTLYSSQGQQQREYSLPIKEAISRVVNIDDQTVGLLTTSGLVMLDKQTGKTSVESFDFGQVNDLVRFDNRLLLLGGSGLWQYDRAGSVYYKVAAYPTGEEYVPESLSVVGKSLLYSTSITDAALRDGSSSARSNVYRVSF